MPAPIAAGAGLAGSVPGGAARFRTPTDTGEFATALSELLDELAGEPDRGTSGDAAGQPGMAGRSGLFRVDGAIGDDRGPDATRATADPGDASSQAFPYGATFAALVPDGPAPRAIAGAPVASTGEPGLGEAPTAGPGPESTGLPTVAGSSGGVPKVVVAQASLPAIARPGAAIGEGVGSLAPPPTAASGPDVGPPTTGLSGAATTTATPPSPGAPPTVAGAAPSPDEAIPPALNQSAARSASSASPVAPAPEAPAGAAVQPAIGLQSLTGTSQPAAVAVSPGAQTLAAQLAPSVMALAASAPGEHVLTIRVTPENLGPVTVQAHIGADGVRIELFTPTDAGRAAVHAVLADLRRDLAGTGIGASLDLSDRGAPAQDPSAREGSGHGGARGRRSEGSSPSLRPETATSRPEPTMPLTSPTTVRLDVFV